MSHIYLNVPFDQKDQAKQKDAKWDAKRKQWYVPDGIDITQFEKWVPIYEKEYNTRASCPFYLLESHESCYKCGTSSKVITFGAAGIEENRKEPVKFEYIALLPERLEKFVSGNYPTYFFDWSNTTETYYYINHCENCGASLGDFFLHSEPDGAFFPTAPEREKGSGLVS